VSGWYGGRTRLSPAAFPVATAPLSVRVTPLRRRQNATLRGALERAETAAEGMLAEIDRLQEMVASQVRPALGDSAAVPPYLRSVKSTATHDIGKDEVVLLCNKFLRSFQRAMHDDGTFPDPLALFPDVVCGPARRALPVAAASSARPCCCCRRAGVTVCLELCADPPTSSCAAV
jgi:hypothetical protein